MLVGNIDQIMISSVSPTAVAAIGNSNQVVNMMIITLSVVSLASIILISVQLGANNYDRVNLLCNTSLAMDIVISSVLGVLFMLLCRPIYLMMKVPSEVVPEAVLYSRIVGLGMVFQGIYVAYVSFFKSYSYTSQALVISLLLNVTNVVGNAFLLYVVPMGIAGVAISTTLSRFFACAASFFLFRKLVPSVKLSRKALKPFPFVTLKKILAIGLPSGGEDFSYNFSQLIIMVFVNMMGTKVINTKIYCSMIAMACYILSRAIAQAQQILIGYLVGQNKIDAIDTSVRKTCLVAVLISEAFTFGVFVLSSQVLGIFTQDAEILALGHEIIKIELILEIGRAVNMVMVTALQASGDIKFPVLTALVCMWSLAVLLGYVLGIVLGWGLQGIWIAMALDECVRAVVFLIRWKKGKWKTLCTSLVQ